MKRIMNFGALLLVASILSSSGYNSLQTKEETVFKARGDIESTLQRRADLIPNLVATVKGYARHEQETLQQVIEARSRATSIQRLPLLTSAILRPCSSWRKKSISRPRQELKLLPQLPSDQPGP